MPDNDEMKSSLGEKNADHDLKPDATPDATEELSPSNEERAIDIGESGQFAPGGRYNELGATKPRRLDLDEQVDSALSNEEK
ncbi:MAG TPA: hypothetical protein VGX48_05050 [Pyrinomonadaceae bacterium]|jgi:hypothetical protein|nr:hypothetical protein [Pyrinomonadaceae bacterium]